MTQVAKTPLYDAHVALGGKIIEFAGWQMPVEYSGILPEHFAVRKKAGLFDVSHMGEVEVKGTDAEAFVQNLVTNDVSVLSDFQVIYGMMCYPDGGVVDDLLVYRYNTEHYLLVINAANIEKDFEWIKKCSEGYQLSSLVNLSDTVAEVALQGPLAQSVLQKLTNFNLDEIKFFHFNNGVMVDGVKCLVSRTGYTGEDGFEIYCAPEHVVQIWNTILDAGKDDGVLPCGLGCRDTLRFEATLPLYGHEISKDISPIAAGLGMFVKLGKPNFIGKEALEEQKLNGPDKKVVGFELIGKGIPRHGYPVAVDGVEIGFVTTGYMAPSVEKTIGLALVDAAYSNIGAEFDVMIRNKPAAAKVISKKFLDKNYKK